MKERHTLVDNFIEQRYEFSLDDDKAVVDYIKKPGVIVLTHTEIPARYEGRGIGSELVEAVLDDARRKGLRVVPQCGFVAAYIRRHPEWAGIVLEEAAAGEA